MASVEEKVKRIIVDQLGVDEDEVKSESSFVDDLGADSLDVVELVMALEEEFGLEINDEDAQGRVTLDQRDRHVDDRRGLGDSALLGNHGNDAGRHLPLPGRVALRRLDAGAR